ncbi:MAG: YfhO family protein [Lachnospiraceae bacterium]|nr:YfhO family protein [Lachnospiraceae bacterium]
MNRIKGFWKKYWLYITAFIIPCIIVVAYAYMSGVWGKGEGSLLNGDTAQQLVPFAYAMWDKVHSGESFSYTWNMAGGIDFRAISSYYISPFTLIILAVPRTWIPNTVQFVMIVKWALSGVAMVYFFYHTRHNTFCEYRKAISLFLGMAYVLGNSALCFMKYIQFGDAYICFPILLLLTEKLVTEKKWKLYYLVLTVSIICDSYLTYETCVFLVIWFVMQLDSEVKEKAKKFFLFAGISVLSAASAVFIVVSGLTVAQSRLGAMNVTNKIYYAMSTLITPIDFIKRLFWLADISIPSDIAPNVYCSLIIETLVLYFIFIKIGKLKKSIYIVALLIMCASFFSGALSLVWHLFAIPNGVYHRFSNLYAFLVIFLAMYVLERIQDIKVWHVVCIGMFQVTAACVTFFNLKAFLPFYTYLVTAMLIILYCVIFILFCSKKIVYKQFVVVLLIVGGLELISNSFLEMETYESIRYASNGSTEVQIMDMLDGVEVIDGERITSSTGITNMGLVANKASISTFVSAINSNLQAFCDRLGLSENGNVQYTVRGGSPLMNLLFNVRYILCRDEMECSDSDIVKKENDIQLYQTKRLAGLGYMVDEDILNWDVYKDPCFDVQNNFIKYAVDGEKIFQREEPDVECMNVVGNLIENDNEYKKEYGSYMYKYKCNYGNQNDSIQAAFTVEKDMDLYMFSYTGHNASIAILIDGELKHKDESSYKQGTYHIGKVKKGQKIEIVALAFEKANVGDDITWFLRFASFNEDAYAKAYEKLSKNVYDIEEMKSDYVKGTIQADEDGIMMTSIQAVDGFTVYVDGQKTDYETIGGALIGVPLKQGKHTVEFKYVAPRAEWSEWVSLAAFLTYVILCIVSGIRTRRQNQLAISEE